MVKIPPYSKQLANLYWMLRHHGQRDQTVKRKYYRLIQAEKNRLFLAGCEKKEVLLLCRYLADPTNKHAESAFLRHCAQFRLDL